MKCSTCRGKDAIIWETKRNEKGEIFCLSYRIGRKMLWWNWDREIEQTVPRAQKERVGITDLRRVAETIN